MPKQTRKELLIQSVRAKIYLTTTLDWEGLDDDGQDMLNAYQALRSFISYENGSTDIDAVLNRQWPKDIRKTLLRIAEIESTSF